MAVVRHLLHLHLPRQLPLCRRCASSSSSSKGVSAPRHRLAHEWVGDGGSDSLTCVLLHGLLGNRKNLRSFARSIVREHPDWRVLMLDLRGHGESTAANSADPFMEQLQVTGTSGEPGSSAPTLFDVAEDVATTLSDEIGLAAPPDMICGHSMGGKVALAYLESALTGRFDGRHFPLHGTGAALAPRSTWTLDTIPSSVDREAATGRGESESVASVLHRVSTVPLPLPSKMALVEALKAAGSSDAVAQWMTTNLVKAPPGASPPGFVFSFHLPTCEALFGNYAALDFLPLVRAVARAAKQGRAASGDEATDALAAAIGSSGCTLDMVRAGRNASAWPLEEVGRLEQACAGGDSRNTGDGGDTGAAALHVVPDSGHNVHIDAPDDLLELMGPTFELQR